MLLICSWLLFFYNIFPNTNVKGCKGKECISRACIGRGCKTGSCEGFKCTAGYCEGEFCEAGDCYGEGCVAGDCYGYGCKPGKCQDPKCNPLNCPQINKNCKDGKIKKIKRPLYWEITKNLPNDTILNPPLCYNKLTLGDLKGGKLDNLGINTISLDNGNNIRYDSINKEQIEEITGSSINSIVTATKPAIFKNNNCEYCTKKGCSYSDYDD
jgi:hypothetical protein